MLRTPARLTAGVGTRPLLAGSAGQDRPESAKSRPWTCCGLVSNVDSCHVAFPSRRMSRFWRDTQAKQGVTHEQGTLSDTSGAKHYAVCVVYL